MLPNVFSFECSLAVAALFGWHSLVPRAFLLVALVGRKMFVKQRVQKGRHGVRYKKKKRRRRKRGGGEMLCAQKEGREGEREEARGQREGMKSGIAEGSSAALCHPQPARPALR